MDGPEVWNFTEGPAPNNPDQTTWVRKRIPPLKAADAVGQWLKYVHGDPAFSLDIPGGWTVIGGEKDAAMTADNWALIGGKRDPKAPVDKLVLTPQLKVSFEYGSAQNLVRAGVSVFSASEKIDLAKLQTILAAQPTDGLTAPPQRVVKQVGGHDSVREDTTTLTTFRWRSYLPAGDNVYVLSFEGPLGAVPQSGPCFDHLADTFLSMTWQPIIKPASPTPAATNPATNGTGSSGTGSRGNRRRTR